MNIFRFELKKHLLSSLIWAISFTGFGYICIQLFVSFSANMNFFDTMLHAYSPEMLKAFGAELSSVRTLPGFYSFCFMYIVVAAAFQAFYMGMHILSKETALKSADFLFTKPVSRSKILTNKLLCVLVCLLIVNLIYHGGAILGAHATGLAYDSYIFTQMNFSMLFTQLLFASFGFFLACVIQKIKTPLVFTTGIVCGFFLLQMIVNLEPNGLLSYFSFLSYVSADTILAHQGFEMSKLCLLLGCSGIFLISGYLVFQHRDIHA